MKIKTSIRESRVLQVVEIVFALAVALMLFSVAGRANGLDNVTICHMPGENQQTLTAERGKDNGPRSESA